MSRSGRWRGKKRRRNADIQLSASSFLRGRLIAIEIKNVDHAASGAEDRPAGNVRIALGESHVEFAVDVLDVVRDVAGGQIRVDKGAGTHDRIELLVEYVDPAVARIARPERRFAQVSRGRRRS